MPPSLQDQLNDARAAYHNLVTGQQARVFVDQNGERLEFLAANRQQLWLYIQQLEAQLAGCARPSVAPLGFLYS